MSANPYFPNWRAIADQILSFLPPVWRSNLPGKVLTRITTALSLSLEQGYATIAQVLRLSIIATSEGQYLRSLIAGFGMTAYDGTFALVEVRFIRFNGLDTIQEIPAGTQVGAVNGVRFKTLATEYIGTSESFVDVTCQALRPGVAGNVGANEIVSLITTISGIDEVRNPNGFTQAGADAEADAVIKARVPRYIESLHRATIPATENAIALDPAQFPEVVQFVTRRNYGTPGYFLGILSDSSGGNDFRARNWTSIGNGIWVIPTSLSEVNGLVAYGFPGRRFGVYSRSANGEERWQASAFLAELQNLTWGFVHDRNLGRIYAKADGRDLNTLNITIVSGVIWRSLRHLELNWAANGVFLDVFVPFAIYQSLTITYTLEPDYASQTVEANLRTAATAYVSGLQMGDDFEAEGMYADLATVAGAGAVLINLGNVTVPNDTVFRLNGNPQIVRRAA